VRGAVRPAGCVVAQVDLRVERPDAPGLLCLRDGLRDRLAVPGGEEGLPDEVPRRVLPTRDACCARGDHEQDECAGAEEAEGVAHVGAGHTGRAVEPGRSEKCMDGRPQVRPGASEAGDRHVATLARHDPRCLSRMVGSLAD
jgi:hypothetical protein